MEWTNILIAICTALGTIFSIFKLFQKKFDKIDAKFDKVFQEFKEMRKETNERFDKIESEIYSINGRLSNIEGQITQMTRPQYYINPINPSEEPKEN